MHPEFSDKESNLMHFRTGRERERERERKRVRERDRRPSAPETD